MGNEAESKLVVWVGVNGAADGLNDPLHISTLQRSLQILRLHKYFLEFYPMDPGAPLWESKLSLEAKII